VNESNDKPPARWTEERVDRLLLKVFGDPPVRRDFVAPPMRAPAHWSHGMLVATCAGLLLLLVPVLMSHHAPSRTVANGDRPAEEIVVAENSDADESRGSEATADEIKGEETPDADSASDTAEASSS